MRYIKHAYPVNVLLLPTAIYRLQFSYLDKNYSKATATYTNTLYVGLDPVTLRLWPPELKLKGSGVRPDAPISPAIYTLYAGNETID